jgi:hypothetical protein
VQKTYQARLFAVSLGVALLLPFAAQGAIADTPAPRELTGERFQLPSPMSREYLQVRRNAPAQVDAPVDVQTPPQPRPAPYTN